MSNDVLTKSMIPLEAVQQEQYYGHVVTVMGVVTNRREAMMAQTSQYTISFTLADTSKGSPEVEVRFFVHNKGMLPNITSEGDIILLSGMKVSTFGGNIQLLADRYRIRYIVSHLDSVGGKPSLSWYPPNIVISPVDLRQMAELRARWMSQRRGGSLTSSLPNPWQHNTRPASRRKFALVRDMVHGNFYDMLGRVVKHFDAIRWVSIYVTDFTDHPRLYPYDPNENPGADRPWTGPWGQYTIQVLLWDSNADAARKTIQEGQYIFLKNMRVKENNDITPCYEGVLHGDRRNVDQIDFIIIDKRDDPRVRELEIREREYQRKQETHERVREMQKISEAKAARKRKRKQEPEDEECRGIEVGPERGNDRVKCERSTMPVLSIDYIKTGPYLDPGKSFANWKYHIFCRVIDYLPKRLEDFAKLEEPDSDEEGEQEDPKEKWHWRFALLVEGRDGATMPLIVHGKEAEYLLNSEATDLRKDAAALAALRKKLSVLWGSLEQDKTDEALRKPTIEQSAAKPQLAARGEGKRKRKRKNKQRKIENVEASEDRDPDDDPKKFNAKFFSAAIMEFGHEKADGTVERKWKLFGTTIHV